MLEDSFRPISTIRGTGIPLPEDDSHVVDGPDPLTEDALLLISFARQFVESLRRERRRQMTIADVHCALIEELSSWTGEAEYRIREAWVG